MEDIMGEIVRGSWELGFESAENGQSELKWKGSKINIESFFYSI